MDERTDECDRADTPLARWLGERIGGRSLGQVERDSGVGKSLLSTYLRGTAIPTMATARKLARYFGVPLEDVMRPVEATRLLDAGESAPALSIPPAVVDALAERVAERIAEREAELLDPEATVMFKRLQGLTPEQRAQFWRYIESQAPGRGS